MGRELAWAPLPVLVPLLLSSSIVDLYADFTSPHLTFPSLPLNTRRLSSPPTTMPRLPPTLVSALFLLPSVLSTKLPSLSVPACPSHGTIHYNNLVPNRTHDFPPTQVDLCYTDTDIHLRFTAYNETNFYYNSSYTTNDPVYEYEVMEAFVARTESDPRTYLEVEVAPNNVVRSGSHVFLLGRCSC